MGRNPRSAASAARPKALVSVMPSSGEGTTSTPIFLKMLDMENPNTASRGSQRPRLSQEASLFR